MKDFRGEKKRPRNNEVSHADFCGIECIPIFGEFSLDNEEISGNEKLAEAFRSGQVDILINDSKLDQPKLCIEPIGYLRNWTVIAAMPDYDSGLSPESDWHAHANCLDRNINEYFSNLETLAIKERIELAENCRPCSVRVDCFEFAIRNQEKYGFWAGFYASVVHQLDILRRKYLYDSLSEEQLSIFTGNLGFNEKSTSILLENGFYTLEDLLTTADADLKKIRGVSSRMVHAWRKKLTEKILNGDLPEGHSGQTGIIAKEYRNKLEKSLGSAGIISTVMPVDSPELHETDDSFEHYFLDEDNSNSCSSHFLTNIERKHWMDMQRQNPE